MRSSPLIPLLFFVLLPLFLLNCSGSRSDKKAKEGAVILRGAIAQPRSPSLQVLKRKAFFTTRDTLIKKIPLSIDEPFKTTLRIDSGGYYWMRHNKTRQLLYLVPGDSLDIRFNGDSFINTLSFKGKGAETNQYLNAKKKMLRNWEKKTKEKAGEEEDSASFKAQAKSLRKRLKSLRQQFRENSGEAPDPDFIQKEINRDLIIWGKKKFLYPGIYRYRTGNDTVRFSEQYWEFMKKMPLKQNKCLQVPGFLEFSYSIAKKAALEEAIPGEEGKTTSTYPFVLFRSIEKRFEGRIKDALLTHFILKMLDKKGKRHSPKTRKNLVKKYFETVENERARKYVRRQTNSRKGST